MVVSCNISYKSWFIRCLLKVWTLIFIQPSGWLPAKLRQVFPPRLRTGAYTTILTKDCITLGYISRNNMGLLSIKAYINNTIPVCPYVPSNTKYCFHRSMVKIIVYLFMLPNIIYQVNKIKTTINMNRTISIIVFHISSERNNNS